MITTLELNKIYSIDCLVGMIEIPAQSIDIIFVDLPYGVTAKNKWDNVIPYEPMWKQFERIIKPNGAILLFEQANSQQELCCQMKNYIDTISYGRKQRLQDF